MSTLGLMKNLIVLFFSLTSISLLAQSQVMRDFSADCPCTLVAQHGEEGSVYACMAFEINATYKVEVERYPAGIPDGLTEREHLNGYYNDLSAQGLSPEWVTFRDEVAVMYRIAEPLSETRMIHSDNVVFFSAGKRYTLIVTTVSGTRRTLFQDFANSFQVIAK